MDARLTAAIVAGQLSTLLLRRFRLGGGTTLPGLVALTLDPDSIAKLGAALPRGSVVVSGTNGKTTTTRMIAAILREARWSAVHNRSGANLLRGLGAALIAESHSRGTPRKSIGLFEVDEAVYPAAQQALRPRVVALTNLFRDQLDRYGEVDYLAGLWREALADLPASSTLVLNADDPLIARLGSSAPGPVRYFGIEDEGPALAEPPHASDARTCGRCGAPYEYSVVYYGHVGKYRCPSCGFRRPEPTYALTRLTSRGGRGWNLAMQTPGGTLEVALPLPGLYNTYNALAAAAVALELGIPAATVQRALEGFTAAFGRLERIEIDGHNTLLMLVKNPVGFGEVLRTLLDEEGDKSLLITINDKFADGTDISWLWDVDFEKLPGRTRFAVTSGTRAEDMALRLKYAGVEPRRIECIGEIEPALARALELTPAGETLYVLPTYTAMLELRAKLVERGLVAQFWED